MRGNTIVTVAIASACWLPATSAHSADAIWWKDERSGCELWLAKLELHDVKLRWSGQCTNGKANGYGRVTYLLEGLQLWVDDYSKESGTRFADGKVVVTLDSLQPTVTCQTERRNRRSDPPHIRRLALTASPQALFFMLRDAAAEKLIAECPPTKQMVGGGDLEIEIATAGRTIVFKGAYDRLLRDKFMWSRVDPTYVYADRMENRRSVVAQAEGIRQQRAQRQQADAASAQAAAAQRERTQRAERDAADAAARDAKTMALADRYGVQEGWIPWNEVSANPFAHEGKTYLVNTFFSRMVTRDVAEFGDPLISGQHVVVTGVPATAFTQQRRWFILIGKVVTGGKANAGPGVPQIKYVGHAECAVDGCADFGKFRKK